VIEEEARSLVERCLRHDAEALRLLARDLVDPACAALSALGLGPADRDDVRQKLLERLVMGEAPRLATYEGRGSLAGFVRAVAVRIALDEKRRTRKVEGDDALLGTPDGNPLPEQVLDKRISKIELREAFHAALAELTPKQRTLLRQAYVDGLSSDAIAHLHGAHRATAFRWMLDARRDLSRRLREELARRLRLRADEIPPFAAFVRSELSLSLSRVLG